MRHAQRPESLPDRDPQDVSDWHGWSPAGLHGHGAARDRIDHGRNERPGPDERAVQNRDDAHDMNFAGRDSAAYYARHGSNAARMQALREYQAQHAEADRRHGREIDHDYHLLAGAGDDRHYRHAAPRPGSRWSAETGASEGGLVEPSYGASPTRQATDFRGRGPRTTRTDARIIDDICARLTVDPIVDATDIRIGCNDGRVALDGEVDTRRMKFRAEDIVDACPGVRGIDNRLRVRHRGEPRIGHWP